MKSIDKCLGPGCWACRVKRPKIQIHTISPFMNVFYEDVRPPGLPAVQLPVQSHFTLTRNGELIDNRFRQALRTMAQDVIDESRRKGRRAR